jgi:hypothetical protein
VSTEEAGMKSSLALVMAFLLLASCQDGQDKTETKDDSIARLSIRVVELESLLSKSEGNLAKNQEIARLSNRISELESLLVSQVDEERTSKICEMLGLDEMDLHEKGELKNCFTLFLKTNSDIVKVGEVIEVEETMINVASREVWQNFRHFERYVTRIDENGESECVYGMSKNEDIDKRDPVLMKPYESVSVKRSIVFDREGIYLIGALWKSSWSVKKDIELWNGKVSSGVKVVVIK